MERQVALRMFTVCCGATGANIVIGELIRGSDRAMAVTQRLRGHGGALRKLPHGPGVGPGSGASGGVALAHSNPV